MKELAWEAQEQSSFPESAEKDSGKSPHQEPYSRKKRGAVGEVSHTKNHLAQVTTAFCHVNYIIRIQPRGERDR
uniref:Uncharacterized protein n=1 Tax=Ascaris lumbricoides TaxID=6252 RepID=A0A0M3HRX1_ASCLU